MNSQIQKLQKLQKLAYILRVLVLATIALSVFYLVYQYVKNDALVLSTSELFTQLWQSEQSSHPVLALTLLPSFAILFLAGYWLQRLLANFQQGQFFCDDAIKSFFWLIWIKVISIGVTVVEDIAVAYYHSQFFEETKLVIGVDLGETLTIIFLLLVAHLLKQAKAIEAENKEFI
ncbi:DUF2975 domain-containing protein [Psychrobium sp. 1_MG-2023]|uniref:DUF2975 domain-containing protein n=1 Tax=Psychrobium sp. 1_MG-2023 TaxID=3062624 RepID=UPI000C3211AD|nr:DUF2975 domain-containing protein [Psychrobium sp. 1_MG-2023]MDP2562298.1 DUF2975 domain-containing protein [Psychrobium sp. 1_MG-2023]PKF54681.1 DUF2975 domain-containing protein [Alteromonadales bacterium alter-6D02]